MKLGDKVSYYGSLQSYQGKEAVITHVYTAPGEVLYDISLQGHAVGGIDLTFVVKERELKLIVEDKS